MNYLSKNKNRIQTNIFKWYELYGRKDLPWKTLDIYKIWISEIMLQQTQVKTVIPYYKKFINKYPDINSLSNSSLNDVLTIWSGLGFYRRAENIFKTALIIKDKYNGVFPKKYKDIIALPGIGRTTASAILTFSRNDKLPILDGNIKRLFSRFFYINKNLPLKELENILWNISEDLLPLKNTDNFAQALMDLGSLICTKNSPKCSYCPLNKSCLSNAKQDFVLKFNKKPLKKIEKKIWSIFIINQNDNIYLKEISLKNLWSGLYSSPIFEREQQMLLWIKNNQLENYLRKDKYDFQHQLSHINIMFIVSFCSINSNKMISENKDYWYNLSNIKCGIPRFQDKIINLYREKYG